MLTRLIAAHPAVIRSGAFQLRQECELKEHSRRRNAPMAKNVARANNARSKVRAAVEHVFARQKGPMALVVRTIGLARATVKIGLANIA